MSAMGARVAPSPLHSLHNRLDQRITGLCCCSQGIHRTASYPAKSADIMGLIVLRSLLLESCKQIVRVRQGEGGISL